MRMTTGESIALEIQFDLTVELLPRLFLNMPKDSILETDIQEKKQKESQKQQIQARNGKDKVKGNPSEENTT
ncbi:hypothetical protein Tco_0263785 [Tanacetum coccineum]